MFSRNKTIKVADMKQVLVDEIKRNNKQYKKVKSLEKEVKKKANVEKDYELALITIDALKNRIDERDITSSNYQKEISSLNEKKINKEKERCNDKEIKINILQDKLNNINSTIEEEVKTRLKHSQLETIDSLIKDKMELNKIIKNYDKSNKEKLNLILNNIILDIQNTKGNISKETIIQMVKKEFKVNYEEKEI